MSEPRSAVGVDLPAQALNLDQVRERIVRFVPHMFGDLFSSRNLPCVRHQKLEKCIFLGRQSNRATPAPDPPARIVDDQIRQFEFGRASLPGTPQ